MSVNIRKSNSSDISFLVKLERESFPEYQQNNKRSLELSLMSPSQEVWIAETNEISPKPIGALILFIYKKTLRIYSIAVLQDYRKTGAGSLLVAHAKMLAQARKFDKVVLEAHFQNSALILWYTNRGFVTQKIISDYYAKGEDSVKMEFKLPVNEIESKVKNIIVTNNPRNWNFNDANAKIISVKEFINNAEYHTNTSLRIFNLCSSYKYQSYGYYVSLLASARGQRIIPSVATIRDFTSVLILRSITEEINELLQQALKHVQTSKFSLNIYFGQSNIYGFKKLALKLYQLFETPLIKVSFIKDDTWLIKKIQPINIHKITGDEFDIVHEFATKYFNKKRFDKARLSSYKYDLAILVNDQEATPPSCKLALEKFKKAAHNKGIYTEFITKNDFHRINEYDALFIRETTNVNNHTYEISRLAYAEGLVVIDDPWSILRCSNKIYQNELFRNNNINTPKTTVFTKNFFTPKALDEFTFPLVIKQPDSAFSIGITKVDSKEQAVAALTELFKKTDMVISQEFTYSDFDWRIGILDNTPIYACKYYMTQGHWQIYNWEGKEEEQSGASETLPISEVPQNVLKTAQKAASLIGDGFYGVDLKEINGKVYVIEVNDNPSIDAGVEDDYLKDKLYDIIIDSILNRIEILKNIRRYVS